MPGRETSERYYLLDNKVGGWTVRGAQRDIFTLDGTQVEQTSYPPELPASPCYGRSRLRLDTHSAMALFFVICWVERSNSRQAFACLFGSEAVF